MMKLKYLCVVTLSLVCLYQNASAELAAMGPVDTTNGFPSWYMDDNGVALELCLTSGICAFDPIVGGNFFSQQIGFGEKAFYWSANASLTGPGGTGTLDMALVASFSGNTNQPIPLNGEQITFFQIVVGPISGLTAGSLYTVTHPLGVIENLVADDSGTIPQQRQDIGCAIASATVPCNFSAVLGSPAGPFLTWDTGAPVGFIGDISTAHTITGSPFNNNVFRIDGPNAGGSGVNTKETNLFNIQGKLFTGRVPTPLIVNQSTYTRPLPSAVDVFATSAPSASLKVSGPGITDTTMVGDGGGNFFVHIPLPGSPPNSITVTADNPPNTTATVNSEVVDGVKITLAEYNSSLFTLTIEASSSDKVVPPILTAIGFGNLTLGKRVVTGLLVPPKEVTVVSSGGGSDTTHVSVTANIKPIAQNDSALTKKNVAVVIDVLANDTAVSGTLDPATVSIVTVAGHGTTSVDPVTGKVTYTPNLNYIGKDSFTYTVKDSFAQISNIAIVNVNVSADEVLTVTKAVFTKNFKWWQISGKSTVKSGNKITLYLGPDTTGPVIGTTTVNAFLGSWSFSKFFSSVDPGTATSITAVSTLGTMVTFPLTIK
jgi:hypothetical protein